VIEACPRCTKTRGDIVKLGLSDLALFGPHPVSSAGPAIEEYCFNYCRSCDIFRLRKSRFLGWNSADM
jgi:hypothetical protein